MFTVSAGGGEFKQFSLEYRSTLPLLPTVQVKEYMSQRIGFTSSLSPFTILFQNLFVTTKCIN